jgi:hypothetical protein
MLARTIQRMPAGSDGILVSNPQILDFSFFIISGMQFIL